MARGFIKDVGGSKRMRFVRPGYDANDMSVPPNQVVFDSNDAKTLSIVHSGEVNFDTPVDGFVVSWSDLGYRPLALLQFTTRADTPVYGSARPLLAPIGYYSMNMRGQQGIDWAYSPADGSGVRHAPRCWVFSTGIYLRIYGPFISGVTRQHYMRMRYVVYRAPV